jgi:hypothetical protein
LLSLICAAFQQALPGVRAPEITGGFMYSRRSLKFALALSLSTLALHATDDAALLQKAKQIHNRIITFDSHLDVPFDFGGPGLEANTDGKSQFDLINST